MPFFITPKINDIWFIIDGNHHGGWYGGVDCYGFDCFITTSNRCKTVEGLTDNFMIFIKEFGFDRFIFSNFGHDERDDKEKNHGILVNYPQEWMARYFDQHYIEVDPVYKMMLVSQKPYTWAKARDSMPETQRAKQLRNEANEFQLRDGIAIPIYQPLGGLVGFGFTGTECDIRTDADTVSIINAASNQFWLVYSELRKGAADLDIEPVFLTPRENDVLCWAARGKTRHQIAEVLLISESAVKRYLEGAFKKLKVNNTALAVAKGLRMGLIAPY